MKEENNFILKKAKELLKLTKVFFNNIKKKISTAVKGELPQDVENHAQGKEENQNSKTEEEVQESKNDANKTECLEKVESSSKNDDSKTESKPCDSSCADGETQRQKNKKNSKEKTSETSSFKEAALVALISIVDLIASVVFIASIVIAIKPSFLTGNIYNPLYNHFYFAEKIGNILIKIEFRESNVSSEIQTLQQCLLGLGFIIFGILKILVLLAAQNGTRKIISILTLAMTFLTCSFVSEKFLLFLIFILLLHIIFEYSCGFSSALIFIKLGFAIILSCTIYIAIHFAIDESLGEKLAYIFTALKFPIPRLW